MTRIKSVLFATFMTLAVSSSALAGDITSRCGDITSRAGDITSRSGDITSLIDTVRWRSQDGHLVDESVRLAHIHQYASVI